MHYLAHASATLRSHTNINALLKHLVVITQNIPGFYHCALYLHEQQHFYQVHLSPVEPEQITYFRQYPLSEASVNILMSDEYRVGQAYVIPVNSEGYPLEAVQQLFAAFEPAYNTVPTGPYASKYAVQPSTSAEDIIAMPLHSDTNTLLGFLLCMPSPRKANTIQEILPLLGLFTDQAATLLEKARLQEEVQNALEQARESELLINHFLITASHELRTPLTSTQGYLELLSEFGSTLTEDMRAYFLDNARRSCEELIVIVSAIMDASRLKQDKLELRPCSVNLLDTVQTIVEILHPMMNKGERRVEIDVAEQFNVWVDSLRLRQILLNLLNNALKYTSVSTKIVIGAEELHYEEMRQRFEAIQQAIILPDERPYIVIKVRDWGPGIAPEYQSRLFTKFMRLSETLNSMQRGAGLGLYLCRQWTEAMDGYIWAESTGISGEGCTFYIALPSIQKIVP
jgi:signal transduction histidine kinase